MISSQTLDVVIGLVVVFLTVSIVCSSINETIAAILGLRAKTLKDGLDSLLGSQLADDVLAHSLVPAVPRKPAPSYIDPALFASAVLDTLITKSPSDAAAPNAAAVPALDATQAFAVASQAISNPSKEHADSRALPALNALLLTAKGDISKLRDEIANWYDSFMDRVSGGYKRTSQIISLVVAVVVVGILNLDTFDIYRQLSTQPLVAAAVAAKSSALLNAEKSTQQSTEDVGQAVNATVSSLKAIPLPIGWGRASKNPTEPWLEKIMGLLVTAIAAALGAPFWFDALGKLANMRSAGPKPDGSGSQSATNS